MAHPLSPWLLPVGVDVIVVLFSVCGSEVAVAL